ncbi:MAG: carboxypeptidase-like regulatory domain-containing protein [Cellulophaga sp.]
MSVTTAQETTGKLEGVVLSESGDVANVHIINITSGKATITQLSGYFSIQVQLKDTVVISAIQYKRKELVITKAILKSGSIRINLEDVINELDEVIVLPFNLSGDLSIDMNNLKIDPIITASTIGLPNAHVKKLTYIEKKMNSVMGGGTIVSLINAINGNTKRMKKFEKSYVKYQLSTEIRDYYSDSLFTQILKIPKNKIADFMYFCEIDIAFDSIVGIDNKLDILDFLERKSLVYTAENMMK